MADLNYTKGGEWKIRDYKIADGSYDICSIQGGLDAHIARVGGLTALPDALANAHLISAAPEMYEALKETINWLAFNRRMSPGTTGSLLADTVNQALAKAEGKEKK